MIQTTLFAGGLPAIREQALFDKVQSVLNQPNAQASQISIIAEGLPSGSSPLDELSTHPQLHIVRLAPACLCCAGNLVLKVHLNRVITRAKRSNSAQYLFIQLIDPQHLPQLHSQLMQAPLDRYLRLTADCGWA
jgi:hypothetical protein